MYEGDGAVTVALNEGGDQVQQIQYVTADGRVLDHLGNQANVIQVFHYRKTLCRLKAAFKKLLKNINLVLSLVLCFHN